MVRETGIWGFGVIPIHLFPQQHLSAQCARVHMHCTSVINFVTQRCKAGGLLWQDIIYVLFACKKDTGLVNVLTHIIVSNVTNTTILFYMRIAGGRMSKAHEIEANSTRSEETSSSPTEPRQGSYCSFKEQRASQVVLATATITVTDWWGTQQPCRGLLDGVSQSSYITETFVQRLQLKRRRNEMPITGINNTCSAATHSMDIKFSSKDSKFHFT